MALVSRSFDLLVVHGGHNVKVAFTAHDWPSFTAALAAHLKLTTGVSSIQFYDPHFNEWTSCSSFSSIPPVAKISINEDVPMGGSKISRKRSWGAQQVTEKCQRRVAGVCATHVKPLERLLMPALQDIIKKAFGVLDATGDGKIGLEDFALRATVAGDGRRELDLWTKLSSYFETFFHGEHMHLHDFTHGLIFMSMRSAVAFKLPELTNLRALLRHIAIEINWHVFQMIVSMMDQARTPLPPADQESFNATIIAYRDAPVDTNATGPFLRALYRWTNNVARESLTDLYRNLDTDGNGTLSADDFHQMPHIWEAIKGVFTARHRTEITFEEMQDGFFSIVLWGPAPPTLATAVASGSTAGLTLSDLCREAKCQCNLELDVQCSNLLKTAGKLTPQQSRMLKHSTGMLPLDVLATIEKAWTMLDVNGDDVLTPEDFAGFRGGSDVWTKFSQHFDQIPGSTPDGAITFDEFVGGFVWLAFQSKGRSLTAGLTLAETLGECQVGMGALIQEHVAALMAEVQRCR